MMGRSYIAATDTKSLVVSARLLYTGAEPTAGVASIMSVQPSPGSYDLLRGHQVSKRPRGSPPPRAGFQAPASLAHDAMRCRWGPCREGAPRASSSGWARPWRAGAKSDTDKAVAVERTSRDAKGRRAKEDGVSLRNPLLLSAFASHAPPRLETGAARRGQPREGQPRRVGFRGGVNALPRAAQPGEKPGILAAMARGACSPSRIIEVPSPEN